MKSRRDSIQLIVESIVSEVRKEQDAQEGAGPPDNRSSQRREVRHADHDLIFARERINSSRNR